jgi:hypothetical protein
MMMDEPFIVANPMTCFRCREVSVKRKRLTNTPVRGDVSVLK